MNTHLISKENGGTGLYQMIRAFSTYTSNSNIIGKGLDLGVPYSEISNEISELTFIVDENGNFIVDDYNQFIIG